MSTEEPRFSTISYNAEDDQYVFLCPHCDTLIAVHKSETNCLIFRHGTLKVSNTQIDPHATKEVCDRLVLEDAIFGCGKPFRIIFNAASQVAITIHEGTSGTQTANDVGVAMECDYL